MKFLSILLPISALLVGVSQAVEFTSPSGGDTITNGKKTTIKWSGSAGGSNVSLQYCKYVAGSAPECGHNIGSGPDNGSYDWTPKDLEDGQTYWILMFSGSGSAPVATSAQFSGKAAGGSSSGGSSSPTSGGSSGGGTTPAPTSGSSGTHVVTTTVTNADGSISTMQATVTGNAGAGSSSSNSGGGGSGVSGATLGGAIGGTVAGIAFIAGIAFLFYRRRKRLQREQAAKDAANDVEAGSNEKASQDGLNSNRNSKLLGKFRHSKTASTASDKKAVIPEPAAGVMEMPENPVYEMPAESEPVEAPSDPRFYAMELDSREVLPPSQTGEGGEKKRPGALDPQELRKADRLSPAIAVSPPADPSVDATGGFGYKAYKNPKEDEAKVEETKPEEKTDEAAGAKTDEAAGATTEEATAAPAEAPKEDTAAAADAPKPDEEATAPAADKPDEDKPKA